MERDIHAITPGKIIIIVLLLIIIIGMVYIFMPKHKKIETKKEPELIHLTFENMVQNHILFSNIKIFKQGDEFYLTAKATNMTSNELKISPIIITLTDDKDNETVLTSYIGNVLNGEDEKSIIIETNKDLKNTCDISINVKAQV